MQMVTSERREWASSLIKSTEYIPDYQKLTVEFSNGQSYTYSEISEKEYEEFCNAESQGKHFGTNFRTKKPYEKNETSN
jgi:hypothetical protein